MNEVEQLQAELNRIQSFYSAVIEDMSKQIARLTYEKSAQVAITQEKEAHIQHLQKQVESEKESK